MNSQNVKKENIWNYKQNKPSYIAKDFEALGITKDIVFKILLARGVFKWLSVRRKIIKLKNIWKERIKAIHIMRMCAKEDGHYYHAAKLKGMQLAYEKCRKEVRELCHSERWQAPDFDRAANKFINKELEH